MCVERYGTGREVCVVCGGGGVEGERREISKWKSMKTLVSNGVEDF